MRLPMPPPQLLASGRGVSLGLPRPRRVRRVCGVTPSAATCARGGLGISASATACDSSRVVIDSIRPSVDDKGPPHLFARQNIAQFMQEYKWAPTRRQLADPLSKLVAKPLFERFAPRMKGLKSHLEWSSDEDD